MHVLPARLARTDAVGTSSAPQEPYHLPGTGITPAEKTKEQVLDPQPCSDLTSRAATVATPDDAGQPSPKPRTAPGARAGRPTLFWIHANPKSISKGTRAEDLKRIRSHVMSEHNRKKRLASTQLHKRRTWKQVAFRSAPVKPDSGPHGQAQAQAPTPAQEQSAVLPSQEKGTEVLSSVSSLIPRGLGLQSAIDPFNTSHTPLTDRMMRHLQHFLVDLSQDGVPFQSGRLDKIKMHWGKLIQNNAACLHACICVASSDIALRTRELPLKASRNKGFSALLLDTFHHRGETIRLVNSGLSDPARAASDGLIASVSMLLTIEIATGTPAYLKMHLAGLRQMVGLRKSFIDVPYPVRYQISWTDSRVACMSLTKPIFPPVRNPRPETHPIPPPTAHLARLGTALLQLSHCPGATISPKLAEIIHDLVQLTWYAEAIHAAESDSPPLYDDDDEPTEDYFNGEVLYVEYMLLSDRYTATGLAKDDDASIEGCVRLACLLFHNSTLWSFYPSMAGLFPQPIRALRVALEQLLDPARGASPIIPLPAAYPNLLLWVLVMGACSCSSSCSSASANVSAALAPERAFFVRTLARALHAHAVTSPDELRRRLGLFFYLDRCYLAELRGLWEELRAVPSQP
ncbi:hypothetical protein ASPACDRAFT_1866705 [Aspergillus aculeatus ATCC 16872]|uniref:Tachykinin family protein n=1 Tax=Aspergillus aculeatus (strain ATCC 16872 / CBS 172.66 / WB 5094) TaxID=690307 RepID=A0A1L9WYL2_ASPA1|nr:uncharacterized protein ASPACDRAFT_1866705 [Aspergillus aculeatus ATCC 16872]OJK01310.1 hypothetical protein ASPACDRAFT_1866705 [Aspergillus aculeatus ATCC 16872]